MDVKQEKSVVSFAFSKKSEAKLLKKVDDAVVHENKGDRDFVSALENQEVKSVKPKEEVKEIVIPLIKTNNWKTKLASESSSGNENQLDSLAVQEIISDAAKQNEDWDTIGKVDPNLQIPLLMQNKVPEGYETDEKLDVSLRPDGPEEADYDEIPIDAYGLAMLKGMGWKPGQGIGRNNKSTAPVEAVLRPKGMGLGADRKQAQNLNDSKKGGNSKKNEEDDGDLTLKKGSCCLIEHGPHKDLYGMIEGLDEDNSRLMVKLTVSRKLVNISQYNIKLVTSKEYNKYSKYLNKGTTDRYKHKELEQKEKNKEKDSEEERDHRKVEDRLSDSRDTEKDSRRDKHKDKHRDNRSENSRKRKYDERSGESSHTSSHSSSNGVAHSSKSRLWVRPKIRVRIIDKNYKKGKYYSSKVVVIDVFDRDHCVCETDEGRVLEDISQSMLETVVPKSDSSYVAIVSGKYRGQIAHVLKRDKSKCEALLQLLSDRDNVLKMDYDSICEYVGDVNEEFDF